MYCVLNFHSTFFFSLPLNAIDFYYCGSTDKMFLIKLTFTLVKNGESKNNKNIVNNLSMAMVLYGNQKYYCQKLV